MDGCKGKECSDKGKKRKWRYQHEGDGEDSKNLESEGDVNGTFRASLGYRQPSSCFQEQGDSQRLRWG